MARPIVVQQGLTVNGVRYPDMQAARERVAMILQDWPTSGPNVVQIIYGDNSFVSIVPGQGREMWLVHVQSEPYKLVCAYECEGAREAKKYAMAYGRLVSNDLIQAEFSRLTGAPSARDHAHWRRVIQGTGTVTATRMRPPQDV